MDVSEASGVVPDEPAWMREVPADTKDPATPPPSPDPVARAAAIKARSEEIVRALNPENPE